MGKIISKYERQWHGSFFNRTIKNTLRNFIPHETTTCDDRGPPWINSSIRHLIQDKNEA